MSETTNRQRAVFAPAPRILKPRLLIQDKVPVMARGHYRSLPAQIIPTAGSRRLKPAKGTELPVGVEPSVEPLVGQRERLDDASLDPTIPTESSSLPRARG